MGRVIVFSLTAAFNPTLIAASTVMMLLPHPVRLMAGYLCGALITSITIGLIIVFSLDGTGFVTTTKQTVSPAATMTLGGIALAAALVLGTGKQQRAAARLRARRAGRLDQGPPRWQRAIGKGSARVTFVVGCLLTLPGASYLAGLGSIDKLNYANAPTVLLVVGFNLVMLAPLEVPLLCFVAAPEWTPGAIERARAWISRHALRFAVTGLTGIGTLLVGKGLIELLS